MLSLIFLATITNYNKIKIVAAYHRILGGVKGSDLLQLSEIENRQFPTKLFSYTLTTLVFLGT